MKPGRVIAVVLGVSVAIGLGAGAWVISSGSAGCRVGVDLAPSCGRWWGAAVPANGQPLVGAVTNLESATGRRLDIVHTYHRWSELFPTVNERALLGSGHLLLVNWQPKTAGGRAVRWASIANGSQDATIDREAAQLRSLGAPILISFSHEPELELSDSPATTGGSAPKQPVEGTEAQFVSAWRHVVTRLRVDGVRNARFVWTGMGLTKGSWPARYAKLWPGNDYVDWVAWDPYNTGACNAKPWRNFAQLVRPFYDYLVASGHGNKPMMLAEYGTGGTPAMKAAWFAQIPTQVTEFPKLKALVYFDYPSPPAACDWRPLKAAATAFGALARSNPFHATSRLAPAS